LPYSVFKVRSAHCKGSATIPQGQKVSQDTKKQIRLISDAYGQTLDRSGACVVGIAAAGS